MNIKSLLSLPFFAGALIAGLSALSLTTAMVAQYGFGMQPCILCIYQRWPYVFTGLLGLAAVVLSKREQGKISALMVLAASVAFLAGGIIAAYHVGVEQHWWKSAIEGCTAPAFTGSAEDILKNIEAAKAVRCDEIPWQMFGISMAGYNALLSLFMSGISAASSLLIVRRANGL